jgi:DNA-binding LacI/PurR family transcriptional regulator
MQFNQLKRREFISLLGGAAAAWPLAARAQEERMRRIGVFMHTAADEPESQARLAAFMQGLQELGRSSDICCSAAVYYGQARPASAGTISQALAM